MISHKHKFVFIQIPKTGTTSIERALKSHPNNLNCKYVHGNISKHFTHTEYLNNKILDRGYFSFTFCRNPWDRLVSQFHFSGKKWWEFYPELQKNIKFTFENYIKELVIKKPFSRHLYTSRLHDDTWAVNDLDWSQYQFISPGVDFIGKYENLYSDWCTICNMLNIPLIDLGWSNNRKHKRKLSHYTEYYTEETRQIIAERYAKDIEYFGYKFGE